MNISGIVVHNEKNHEAMNQRAVADAAMDSCHSRVTALLLLLICLYTSMPAAESSRTPARATTLPEGPNAEDDRGLTRDAPNETNGRGSNVLRPACLAGASFDERRQQPCAPRGKVDLAHRRGRILHRSSGTFSVLRGLCRTTDHDNCVQSPNYPAPYNSNDYCVVAPLSWCSSRAAMGAMDMDFTYAAMLPTAFDIRC
ncbi:hypothetical protein CYMTET_19622 [Cymbomonas tetramitiformis]|uniref:Uncharacterized protein n=1 Tax=Cymbomonas tetramitiformis TaxID=36881 RepID=A0AAE0L504_9CHLO|nr:hypothetical protein CYMTET_19622 [Cymbomonas tetramitiformis]